MAKIEMFEKRASIECDFDWWPEFQVIIQIFLHTAIYQLILLHYVVLLSILQMESGKLT